MIVPSSLETARSSGTTSAPNKGIAGRLAARYATTHVTFNSCDASMSCSVY